MSALPLAEFSGCRIFNPHHEKLHVLQNTGAGLCQSTSAGLRKTEHTSRPFGPPASEPKSEARTHGADCRDHAERAQTDEMSRIRSENVGLI